MRFKLGPRLESIKVRRATDPANPPDEVPTGKLDVEPEIVDLDVESEPLRVTLRVPAYDLSTHNRLVAVSAVVIPMGQAAPDSADGWVAAPLPRGETDTTALAGPGDLTIDVPGVPDGLQIVQTILHFEN